MRGLFCVIYKFISINIIVSNYYKIKSVENLFWTFIINVVKYTC